MNSETIGSAGIKCPMCGGDLWKIDHNSLYCVNKIGSIHCCYHPNMDISAKIRLKVAQGAKDNYWKEYYLRHLKSYKRKRQLRVKAA